MALSEQRQKIRDAIVEMLEGFDDVRLQSRGGYPSVFSQEWPGHLIQATVDYDEAPDLNIWTWIELESHYKCALKLHHDMDNEDFDMQDAWGSTHGKIPVVEPINEDEREAVRLAG